MGTLLKPGADRLAPRRTKAAALQIATDRLAAVKSALVAAGISADRINVANSQFKPTDELLGGEVVVLVVRKK